MPGSSQNNNTGSVEQDRLPFLRHLTLRPHGSRLLTAGAAFWLLGAQVLVLAMAFSEAVSWGYLGYLFGNGDMSWIVAVAVGIVIFSVVWMIDVSLLTLDRASEEHAEKIFGERSSSKFSSFKTWFAIASRIFIVVASLTITAPYLAQLVFHKEIEQWIETEAVKRIEAARVALDSPENQVSQAALEKEAAVIAKRQDLEYEVAGKGLSGIRGEGITSGSMRASLAKLENEWEEAKAAKQKQTEEFEVLVKDWKDQREALASKYNLVLPQASILANREALNALREKPEHRQTELAIQAFLAFIFIGLLILKLFEPRSIRFYLSEVLQQEYARYLAGSFDHVLPVGERSTGDRKAMTPQRLYDFLANVWAPRRAFEAKELEKRVRRSSAEADIKSLEEMLRRIELRLTEAQRQVEQERLEAEEATESYNSLLQAINLVQGHVTSFRQEFNQLPERAAHLDPLAQAEYGTHLRSKLAEATRKLQDLERVEGREKEKLVRTQSDLKEAEEKLRKRKDELARVEEQIQQQQLLLLNRYQQGDPVPREYHASQKEPS